MTTQHFVETTPNVEELAKLYHNLMSYGVGGLYIVMISFVLLHHQLMKRENK